MHTREEEIINEWGGVCHMSGLASSGVTVKVSDLSWALFTTTLNGFPILSPIISIICKYPINHHQPREALNPPKKHLAGCLLFVNQMENKCRTNKLLPSYCLILFI